MARIAAHSQEQVFQAADALAAEGRDVTASALREVLGRGSFSTLGRHLAEWQRLRPVVVSSVELPMPDSVKAAFSQAWKAAAAEASRELVAIREQLAVERQAVEQRLSEALVEIERLESEAEADAARLEDLEQRRLSEVSALKSQLDHAQASAQQKLSKASEMAVSAREEAAQVRGELMGLRVAFSELLAAKPLDVSDTSEPVAVKSSKATKKPASKTAKKRIPEEQPLPL